MSIQLAWRYLRGRGLRSLLTTLAIVIGVGLTFGLNGIIPAMQEAFTRNLTSSTDRIDLTVTDSTGQPFAASVADKLAAVPGIAAVSPGLSQLSPIPQTPGAPAGALAQVTVLGIDPLKAHLIRDYPIRDGRMLSAGDGFAMVLSSDLADELGLRVGSTFTLPAASGTARFTVAGLLATPTVPGAEQVIVPLATAQQIFGLGGRLTQLEASFAKDADATATQDAAARALGPSFNLGAAASMASSLMASMEVGNYAFLMFGIFALATAAFIILNSFRTIIAERRHDIGMLRAIGMTRRKIIAMFLVESLFQGILGTALGLVAGWGLAASAFAALNPIMEKVVHMSIGSPVFTPSTWVTSIVLGVGVTVAAAIIPARAAGRVTAMEAMRPQVGEVIERRIGRRAWVGAALMVGSLFGLTSGAAAFIGFGAIVFLVGMALLAPAVINPIAQLASRPMQAIFQSEGPIARSNLQRNPGRSATTVTTVMLGLAAIVAVITMVNSIMTGFVGFISKSMSADYMLIPQSIVLSQGNVAAGPGLAQKVAATPGIADVSTLRLAKATMGGEEVQVIGIDPDTYLKVANFDWKPPSSDQAVGQLRAGRWIVANGIYASQHGLSVGQPVQLGTPNGQYTYYVAGIGNDYLNAKLSTIYTSQANLTRDFNATNDLMVMANRAPTADAAAVQAGLERVTAQYPAFRLYESESWRNEQTTTFDSVTIIFNVLIAALAIPSLLALINTLTISVLGRTREIGMLRAIGSTRKQVRRMVIAESLLLSVIGTVFGAASGLWLGYALVKAMGAIGWETPYLFPWTGLLVTVVVGFVFGMLAAVGPSRSAARLDVVDALHHE